MSLETKIKDLEQEIRLILGKQESIEERLDEIEERFNELNEKVS